ncbi:hypothetical protein H6F67_22360 [Microcoleus sp. FACHB-1515]|uniref:hypothetical protein n=1 Tax=Cyanophyceae TaxID=3028117 RepID=UPI001686DA19|nr:hypothetical protein [Microcoleus sp. FACHB-1515]MBD2092596.1 hypothetical protein [Microcoleus sp. FACHB-1515]
MLQIPGIFGIVTYWQFAKSIRLLVFVAMKFLATSWRSFSNLSEAIRSDDRFADVSENCFIGC